jgi:hypothetical protein
MDYSIVMFGRICGLRVSCSVSEKVTDNKVKNAQHSGMLHYRVAY